MKLTLECRLTLDQVPDAVLICDTAGLVIWASREVAALTGGDLVANTLLASHVVEADRELLNPLLDLVPGARATVRMRAESGACWCEMSAGGFGERGVIITARDATSQMNALAALEATALTDPLTGLPNRQLFDNRLRQALDRAERSGATTTVFVADIDKFKLVNDTLGHRAGDAVLRCVADALRGSVRPSDTVSRWGGDEFVVLSEELPTLWAAQQTHERIIRALRIDGSFEGAPLDVTGTVGMAQIRAPRAGECIAQHAADLLHAADMDMYRTRTEARHVRIAA